MRNFSLQRELPRLKAVRVIAYRIPPRSVQLTELIGEVYRNQSVIVGIQGALLRNLGGTVEF